MYVLVRMYFYGHDNLYLVTVKHITLFSLFLDMKKRLEAKVKANVKVYLIPHDQLQFDENGKPKLDDKYLVYQSKKKGG